MTNRIGQHLSRYPLMRRLGWGESADLPGGHLKRLRSSLVIVTLVLLLIGGGTGVYVAATGHWPWNTSQRNTSQGNAWELQPGVFSGLYPSDLHGVAWSGTQFVAVGYQGTIQTSSDGQNWTQQNAGTSNFLSSVVWSGIMAPS